MTSATAGRAILFSGLTVVAGLTGMLFFENTGLPSLGWGGICATLVALTSSVILLPSILAILGDRINSGRVPLGLSTEVADDGFWYDLAKRVMSKPHAGGYKWNEKDDLTGFMTIWLVSSTQSPANFTRRLLIDHLS